MLYTYSRTRPDCSVEKCAAILPASNLLLVLDWLRCIQ
jgi:hypothetical protein